MQSSWRSDWFATVIQGVPRVAALSRHMKPTLQLDSIASLQPDMLESLGVRGVIWDVDGTLMPRHACAVAPQLSEAFQRLADSSALCHVILSNCDEGRFVELGGIFPGIPILRVYEDEDGVVVRRRLGVQDTCAVGGSSSRSPTTHARTLERSLRKPSAVMLQAALAELGCASPAHAVMIGDQYLTDIAPANMLGVRTVKVRTVDPRSFPLAVRMLWTAERILFRISTWNAAP